MRIRALRLGRYLLGAFLIGWGLCALGYELLFPSEVAKESTLANMDHHILVPNTFCAVIIVWGLILVLTTLGHHRGGIWTFFGTFLLGVSMMFAALTVDAYLVSGASLHASLIGFGVALFFLFVGIYSLVAGQIRHRRFQRETPTNHAD